MARIKKTEGIVIRVRDFTETSQLVWLYTKDFGKIKIMAKGVRAKAGRLKTKFDLFGVYEILYYYSRKSEIHTLNESQLVEPFGDLRMDLSKMAFASYACELLDSTTALEDPHPEIYMLIFDLFKYCSKLSEIGFIRFIFENKLFQYIGCLPKTADLSKGAAAIVKKITGVNDLQCLQRLKPSGLQMEELNRWMRLVIDYLLGKRLKSLEFLEHVGSNALCQKTT